MWVVYYCRFVVIRLRILCGFVLIVCGFVLRLGFVCAVTLVVVWGSVFVVCFVPCCLLMFDLGGGLWFGLL